MSFAACKSASFRHTLDQSWQLTLLPLSMVVFPALFLLKLIHVDMNGFDRNQDTYSLVRRLCDTLEQVVPGRTTFLAYTHAYYLRRVLRSRPESEAAPNSAPESTNQLHIRAADAGDLSAFHPLLVSSSSSPAMLSYNTSRSERQFGETVAMTSPFMPAIVSRLSISLEKAH
jgi:hypothetical protein